MDPYGKLIVVQGNIMNNIFIDYQDLKHILEMLFTFKFMVLLSSTIAQMELIIWNHHHFRFLIHHFKFLILLSTHIHFLYYPNF